jgi:hypothetical protein
LYARFLLDRFCAGYDSASQAGGGTEEPIYSQALLLEPRHGLPPPLPQIALRFAAQINLEGQKKIQATALCAFVFSFAALKAVNYLPIKIKMPAMSATTPITIAPMAM